MRLLLDEIYPSSIADQLRAHGHDVDAVTARAELRSLPDDGIFAAAQQEQRAVVTENIGDFCSIADAADLRGLPTTAWSSWILLGTPAGTHERSAAWSPSSIAC